MIHSQGDVIRETPGRAFGTQQDVTELRERERRLEAAQRLAHVGWWERDYATGHVSSPTRHAGSSGAAGRSPQWLAAWLSLHPSRGPERRSRRATPLARRSRYDVEYRVVRPDGTVRMVHSQGRRHAGRVRGAPCASSAWPRTSPSCGRRSRVRARQDMLDLAQKAARAVAFDWHIGSRESENRWSPGSSDVRPGAGHVRSELWRLEKAVHPDDWPTVKAAIERRTHR